MPEETKDEYIARHRKESGVDVLKDISEEDQEDLKKKPTLKERLNTAFFIIGLAVFIWVLLQIFGMMKSN